MRSSKRHITVQLVGGLGNQLFGFYAGLAVAHEQALEIRFDVSQFNRGFTAHGSDIQSFDLDYKFVKAERAPRLVAKAFRVVEAYPFSPTFLKSLARRLSLEYTSRVDGFDSQVFESQPGSLIRGYFQSYVYLEKLRGSGNFQFLKLKTQSDWYRHMTSLLAKERPVSIHFRRGDYRLLAEEFGLLSSTYYSKALQQLTNMIDTRFSVWVFSDDIAAAKAELGPQLSNSVGLKKVRWIEPPLGSDPAESLLLMSQASAHIISNSTFAWWGAALSSNDGPVVAPEKWFRGKADPDLLYPTNWIQVESSWVQ